MESCAYIRAYIVIEMRPRSRVLQDFAEDFVEPRQPFWVGREGVQRGLDEFLRVGDFTDRGGTRKQLGYV